MQQLQHLVARCVGFGGVKGVSIQGGRVGGPEYGGTRQDDAGETFWRCLDGRFPALGGGRAAVLQAVKYLFNFVHVMLLDAD